MDTSYFETLYLLLFLQTSETFVSFQLLRYNKIIWVNVMKRQNCINCIFSSWYGNFKQITFRSKIVKLPCEFVEYLKSDGIVLPDSNAPAYSNELEGYSDDDDSVDWEDQERNATIPEFPELQEEVDAAIISLGNFICLLKIIKFPTVIFKVSS